MLCQSLYIWLIAVKIRWQLKHNNCNEVWINTFSKYIYNKLTQYYYEGAYLFSRYTTKFDNHMYEMYYSYKQMSLNSIIINISRMQFQTLRIDGLW